jgi:thioredoxin-related protein
MKTLSVICLTVIFSPAALLADETVKPAIHWVRNIDEGLKLAREQKKDMLINFTGHGWCRYCTLLDEEIFSKPEFAAAQKDFILVELDYPSAEDYPEGLQDLYEGWKKKYLITGNPIVVLTDESGTPYAYTGYIPKIGPKGYLRHLSYYAARKKVRDRYLAAAQQQTGLERAQSLHRALSAVSPNLGSLKKRETDALIVFYSNIIDEICKLDSEDKAGLLTIYKSRQQKLNDYVKREYLFTELDKFDKESKYGDAVKHIDRALPLIADSDLRRRFKKARLWYLEHSERCAEALEYAKILESEYSDNPEFYDFLKLREAYNLCHLNRIDDAIAIYDERIAARPAGSAARLDAINWKAEMISCYSNDERALAACREYRDATEPGSTTWEFATSWWAGELAEQGNHQAAIEKYQEIIKTRGATSPRVMLQLTKNQLATMRFDDARQSLDLTDSLIKTLPQNPEHKRDKDSLLWLREESSRLRKELEQKESAG